jgi:hypothetical protein
MNFVQNSKILIAVAAIISISVSLVSCIPLYWGGSNNWFPIGWSPLVGLPFGLFGLAVYLLPTIVAALRHAKSMVGIVLLNVLLGWTFIGWIIALIWSLTGKTQKA